MALIKFTELDADGSAVVGLAPKNLTAENTFTDEFIPKPGEWVFSIRGTFVATVSVQRSLDDGVTYSDLEQFTSAVEGVGRRIIAGERFRIGIKTGDYTSGTVTVEAKQ